MTFRDDINKILDAKYKSFETDNEYPTIDDIFFNSDYSSSNERELADLNFALYHANINVEYVDSYGGEGMGDEYWTVYKFTRDDETQYLKFDGWYRSYVGTEFNERRWVKPVEVLVTKFVDIVDA